MKRRPILTSASLCPVVCLTLLASCASTATSSSHRACERGDAAACMKGEEQTRYKDDAESAWLLQRACQLGSLEGCVALGSELGSRVPVPGVCADSATCTTKAQTLYRYACDRGSCPGCFLVSDLAVQASACTAGCAQSCWSLAHARRRGDDGQASDAAAAALLFERACDLGHADACWELGHMLVVGEGITKDSTRGEALIARACASGSERCRTYGGREAGR